MEYVQQFEQNNYETKDATLKPDHYHKNNTKTEFSEIIIEPLIEIIIKQENLDDSAYTDNEIVTVKEEPTFDNTTNLNFENVDVKQEYTETWMNYENAEYDNTNVANEIKLSTPKDNSIPCSTVTQINKKLSSINNLRFTHLDNNTKATQQNKTAKGNDKLKSKNCKKNLQRSLSKSAQPKKSTKRRSRRQTIFESNTVVKPFNCSICGKKYALKYNLIRHIDTHSEKRFICDVCQSKFIRKSHLVSHMKIHTGDRPFSCNICHKRFTHKSSVTSHLMTHTGEKPYKCDICNNKFAQKSTLYGHMKIHTGEKPFACELCNSKFAHRSTLVSHMATHTGERPYCCKICENKFSLKSTLSRHMKTQHNGDKKFSCCVCHVKFVLKSHLEKHLQTHTDSG